MSSSPEFFQPSPTPDYTTHLFIAVTAAAHQDEEDYYYCHTPTGADISYIRKPATCPPAPIKQQRPPSACRKRLFAAADIVPLNFGDLEAVFRPASLPDGKPEQQPRRARDNSNKPHSTTRSVSDFSN